MVMKLNWKLAGKIALLCFLSLVCGCGRGSRPLTTVVPQDSTHAVQRILVLPFENESDEEQLGVIATRICQQRLFNYGFQLVNEGDLRVYLHRHQLFLSQLKDEGTLQLFSDLARKLQVSTLIKGEILTAVYENIQSESLPVVTLQLDLLNAVDGRVLASSFQIGRGDDSRTLMRFGVQRTATQVLAHMIDDIINNWYTKGVFR